MLGTKLREFAHQHGVAKTVQFFTEACKAGKIPAHEISLRRLAEGILGNNWAVKLERWNKGGRSLVEATDAVDASAFADITGQLLVDSVGRKYEAADKIGLELVETIPVTNGNLGTYKEPFLSDAVDLPSKVQQGMEYPATVFKEQWVTYPAPVKYGLICRVTFEMIFSDLTRQAIESAENIGDKTAIWQEQFILRTILGIDNTYTWNGTTYNTYQVAAPYVNVVSGQTLIDWTSFNAVEQLFVNMLNPVTGLPIRVKPTALLVMPYRYYNAKRALTATMTASGNIAALPGNQVWAANPLEVEYPIRKSAYAYQLALSNGAGPNVGTSLTPVQAQEYFFLGDFKRAFVWRQVYPLQVVQAPPQNPAEFNQDIVLQVKASIYGTPGVRDPRYVAVSYNT